MKVFISSTSEDLREHRQIAAAVVRDAQCAAVVMEHFPADPRPILQLCRAKIAECDLVLLIMAHRRGWVPGPTKGGDTDSSITALEMAAADELKRPVLAFLADDDWPGRLWDDDSTARKWVKGFRGDLNRMAKLFAWEDEPKLPLFRALLSQELANYRSPGGPPRAVSIPLPTTVTLRQPDNPSFPNEPYPLLAPYEHPATFAGRDAEVEQLAGLVALSPFVLCVHAPSGAGKSSLLLAGLAPRLRDEGYAVSVDRAPGDPQLSQRLLRDLIEPSSVVTLVDDDDELPRRFADWVAEVHRLSRKRVVFVLDQIDDVLRWRGRRDDALARLGILMAATAQRLPGVQGFACKWVLCYRHEFHGEVRAWLEDVLVQARTMDRTGLKALPYDLSDTQRSHDWALPVMGKPAPDALGMWASVQAFRRAIEQPLQLMEAGGPRYPYVFAPGAAERLATAFAGARHRQPDAPLVPELQVVLAHLLARARQSSGAVATRVAELITVEVPSAEELEALIGRALTDHLGRALAKAFPQERDSAGGRTARTRASIALRHLADEGHRGEGVPQGDLVAMIGGEGTQVLARLSAADTRLVVVAEEACTLSHDKLAEVVLEVVDNEARRGNLLLDQPLLDLRRTVAQKAALYRSDSKDKSALLVTHAQRVLVEKNRDALLVSDDHRRWWQAQEQLRARDIRQFVLRGAAILVIIVSISSFAYRSYQQATTAQEALESNRLRSQLVEIVSQNRPNFVQLATLVAQETSGWNRVELNDDFVDSINPELFAAAPWLPPSVDATRILDVVERSHPLFVRSRKLFGAMSFALEEVFVLSDDSDIRGRARKLANTMRSAFIAYHKERGKGFQEPPVRADADPLNELVRISGGEFQMGTVDVSAAAPSVRKVSVPQFHIQRHEVTNEEYRRFDQTHQFPASHERHPVAWVSWYEAVAYAAWLGGSLPTEVEWEYAARGTGELPPAGKKERPYPWGFEPVSATRAVYRSKGTAPVGSLEAGRTPQGLDDMAGNVTEWCRDWLTAPGKTAGRRVLRGGSFFSAERALHATFRGGNAPGVRGDPLGFRVVSSRLHR